MKVTEVIYGIRRVTRRNETDTASATVTLDESDDPADALRRARQICDDALAAGKRHALEHRLAAALADPRRQQAVEDFLDGLK